MSIKHLTIAATILVASVSASNADTIEIPSLKDVSTQEIATALSQRGIPVPGHANVETNWPNISNFALKVAYDVGNDQLINTTIKCNLNTGPCVIEIPKPSSVRKGKNLSFAFVGRKALRQELLAEGQPPVGLDSLRGDAIGIELIDDKARKAPIHKFKDGFLGRWISLGRSNYMDPPNKDTRIVNAGVSSNNQGYRWAVSYTHFRKNGLVVKSPHRAGGTLRIDVVDGDPAPGVFDYALQMNPTSMLIDELADRGIATAAAVHVPSPARFLVLFEADVMSKTGTRARTQSADKQRVIVCDLTRGPCDATYMAPWGERVGYFFLHPQEVASQMADQAKPMLVGLGRATAFHNSSWAEFESVTGLKTAKIGMTNADPVKPEIFTVDDFMTTGILNDGENPTIKWHFKLQVIRILH